ncbi:MAG: hypothetical protein KIT70_11115 [Anaerolineales bacterium]|nr:MAG: hypothetical protein KIT70_11115 [Anaerolineales bacterium]
MRLVALWTIGLTVVLAACQTAPVAPSATPTASAAPTLPQPTNTAAGPTAVEIVSRLQDAVALQQPLDILALLGDYPFGYAMHIEGGQSVTRQEFSADLAARLPSAPSCLGYVEDEFTLQVWFENWSPAWEMHESCYAECEPLAQTWYSTTVGFLFDKEPGEWVLKALFLNTPDGYYL